MLKLRAATTKGKADALVKGVNFKMFAFGGSVDCQERHAFPRGQTVLDLLEQHRSEVTLPVSISRGDVQDVGKVDFFPRR